MTYFRLDDYYSKEYFKTDDYYEVCFVWRHGRWIGYDYDAFKRDTTPKVQISKQEMDVIELNQKMKKHLS